LRFGWGCRFAVRGVQDFEKIKASIYFSQWERLGEGIVRISRKKTRPKAGFLDFN